MTDEHPRQSSRWVTGRIITLVVAFGIAVTVLVRIVSDGSDLTSWLILAGMLLVIASTLWSERPNRV